MPTAPIITRNLVQPFTENEKASKTMSITLNWKLRRLTTHTMRNDSTFYTLIESILDNVSLRLINRSLLPIEYIH